MLVKQLKALLDKYPDDYEVKISNILIDDENTMPIFDVVGVTPSFEESTDFVSLDYKDSIYIKEEFLTRTRL